MLCCMVIFTLFFTLGVWLLQQQSDLPSYAWAWLLGGISLLYPLSRWREKARMRGKQNGNHIEYRFAVLVRIALIAVFACALGFYYAAWQGERRLSVDLPSDWQGKDIDVIGVVAGLPHITDRGLRFRFDVEKSLPPDVQALSPTLSRVAREGAKASLHELPVNAHVPSHIYLSTYTDPKYPPLMPHAGERWQLTVRLKQVHGTSNPNAFDFELWALENDVRATGYVNNRGQNRLLNKSAGGFSYRIEALREAVRNKFSATLGNAPYAGVLTALAVGDQGSIPQSQWQIFTRTGVNHLMSISGLHITMLSGAGFALVYWLWRRSTQLTLYLPARKAAAAAALLVAYGYALLSGYGVPAQRTVYMVASVACALWLNRSFSLSQILCIALLGVLLADPWAVLAPGFWLSFGAVALIFFVTAHRIGYRNDRRDALFALPPVENSQNISNRILRILRDYAIVQWAISIGLIPIMLALFGQISLVAPIANAFAIPLVSLIVVPLALLGALLPWEVPLWMAHIAMDLTVFVLQPLSELPQAVWIQHAPRLWCILSGMLGALWMLLPRGFPARWLGVLLMLPMFLNSPKPPATGSLRMIVFDVGQGLSVAMQTHSHALLYDTGPDFSGESDSGRNIIVPALRARGITKLDGVILSHDDIDHTGGTASVLQAMPTHWVASSQPLAALQTVSVAGAAGRRCIDGDRWNWDGVIFEMLHPGTGNVSTRLHDNDLSCVLRISTGNQRILLAGDIEKRGEQRLLREHAEQLSASLLVVPHHGSSSSSHINFVAAVLPDYAVFTSGYRNRFGHPKQQIRQRYIDSGAELLRSDRDGAILVDMDKQGLELKTYRRNHRRYWMHQMELDR